MTPKAEGGGGWGGLKYLRRGKCLEGSEVTLQKKKVEEEEAMKNK